MRRLPPRAVPLRADRRRSRTGRCRACGAESKVADLSDSAVFRLITRPDGEVVVVPVIAKTA